MIYVRNSVFMHCARMTLRNNQINNMLVYISTWQDWCRIHSNIETCEESRIGKIGCWTRNRSTSTKRGRILTISTTSNSWKNKIWGSIVKQSADKNLSKPRLQQGPQLFASYTAKSCKKQASAVPPDITRFLAIQDRNDSPRGKYWKPKGRVKSLEKSRFDSRCLCRWRYWYIDIISKPSDGTSNQPPTSSMGWLRAGPTHGAFSEQLKNSSISTRFICSYDVGADWNYSTYSRSRWIWRTPKQREVEQLTTSKWLQRTECISSKFNFKKRSVSFFSKSQSLNATDW